MINKYFLVNSLSDAVSLSSRYAKSSRILAGGTDLLLEMEKGQHSEITEIIDISRICGLDTITIEEAGLIHIGPMVTHSTCINSKVIQTHARCLYQACENIGSPQIRNRGTIAGNLVTASPANDTITALMALNAIVVLTSLDGDREIELRKFFIGVRRTTLLPGEIVKDIYFPALKKNAKSVFTKIALRNAQAISIANVSVVLEVEKNTIIDARIGLGAVAPTIIRATEAENFLVGKEPSELVFVEASKIAANAVNPISDIRASDNYRKKMIEVHVKRSLCQALDEKTNETEKPVLLWGKETKTNRPLTENTIEITRETGLEVNINGREFVIKDAFDKTLLDMIRENALLTGTKEGCGEGECGACTVFMDGITVLACLIPAPRAHKSKIVTIEGIAEKGRLHQVQKAFIEEGAVQCGYCTPGFVMSAVKLLEENKNPTKNEIKMGISGNLCRCTGYYKIITAIEKAAERI